MTITVPPFGLSRLLQVAERQTTHTLTLRAKICRPVSLDTGKPVLQQIGLNCQYKLRINQNRHTAIFSFVLVSAKKVEAEGWYTCTDAGRRCRHTPGSGVAGRHERAASTRKSVARVAGVGRCRALYPHQTVVRTDQRWTSL